LAPSGIGRVSCGSLVGAAEQPAVNKAIDMNPEAKAKPRVLMRDRHMPALIWRRRRSVNRLAIDAYHTTLLKVESSELPKEEDET
jgi:hypothetical protein